MVSHPEASGYVSNNIKTMKRLIYLVSCLSVSVFFLSSCDKGETETSANPADYLRNDDQKAMVSTYGGKNEMRIIG